MVKILKSILAVCLTIPFGILTTIGFTSFYMNHFVYNDFYNKQEQQNNYTFSPPHYHLYEYTSQPDTLESIPIVKNVNSTYNMKNKAFALSYGFLLGYLLADIVVTLHILSICFYQIR